MSTPLVERSSASAPVPEDWRPPTVWVLVALALMALGGVLQESPWNRAFMLWVHQQPVWPGTFWAAATLLAFGWAALVLVSVSDRGADGARAVLLAFVGGGLLSQALKGAFALPRPGLVLPEGALHFIGDPVLHSGSMPSGHALAAFSIGSLWVCLLRSRGACPLWVWLAWGAAALMAASRVAVGAHWPSDVLVGSGLGLLVGWLAWHVQRAWARSGRWGGASTVALPVLVEGVAAVAAATAQEGYPQVLWLQWLLVLAAASSALWRGVQWWRGSR